jgi:uncharacterized protein YecT (DUF1311 family)
MRTSRLSETATSTASGRSWPSHGVMVGCYGVAMKPVACLLACLCLSVSALAAPPDNPVEQKRVSLQQRGAEVLSRERERSKAHLCEDGPDSVVADCWVREGKATDADYKAYVRAIGALLRLPAPSVKSTPLPDGPPKPLQLDVAEAAWLTYRQHTCDAMTIQWEGGTLYRVAYPRCLVTVTWDHMNELADLYAGLW